MYQKGADFMDIKKTVFWGVIFGIIIAMLTFDVDVFDPKAPEYLGLKEGYASMGIHFAVIVPMCIGAAFLAKYMDLKSVGGRENWNKRKKVGRATFVISEVAAAAFACLLLSVMLAGIASGLELIPKEDIWRYVWIIMAVYGGAAILQLLNIKRKNRFRKTS